MDVLGGKITQKGRGHTSQDSVAERTLVVTFLFTPKIQRAYGAWSVLHHDFLTDQGENQGFFFLILEVIPCGYAYGRIRRALQSQLVGHCYVRVTFPVLVLAVHPKLLILCAQWICRSELTRWIPCLVDL